MRDVFLKLMKNMADVLGVENLPIENDEQVVIGFDESIVTIQYFEEADQLLIYTDLFPLPEQNREAFYEALLEGQFFFQHTRGSTLGINKELNIVLLQTTLALSILDTDKFMQFLENFMHIVSYWKENTKHFFDPNTNSNLSDNNEHFIDQNMIKI